MFIEPKKINPGFLKRNIKNSFDLFLRAPFIFLGFFLIYLLYIFSLDKLNITYNQANLISFFISSLILNFGIILSMYVDKYKISFPLFFDFFLLSSKSFFYLIKARIPIIIVYFIITYIFYNPNYVQDLQKYKNFDYLFGYSIFIGSILIFVGKSFNQYYTILFLKLNEKNFDTKNQIINSLLLKAHITNPKLSVFSGFFPVILLFIISIPIFFLQSIVLVLLPIFIYTSYREIFEGIDKNQKAFDIKTKTAII